MSSKQKYYAVKNGRKVGIFLTYAECLEQVSGFKGAQFKSFLSMDEAKMYLSGKDEQVNNFDIPTVYVDGSYDVKTNSYSFGAVLIDKDNNYSFSKMFLSDKYSQYRNVAGEIRGASFIIDYCIKQGYKEINLYYDYAGIEKWYTNEWQAKNELTINYQKFAEESAKKINVHFMKVKSHSNNKYNDMVDRLAKDALSI